MRRRSPAVVALALLTAGATALGRSTASISTTPRAPFGRDADGRTYIADELAVYRIVAAEDAR